MHERIDTRLRVGLRRIDNTIHHAARTSRRGHLARLQNIQREGVVWLVTRTIRYWCTFFQTKFFSCRFTYYTLYRESRNNISQNALIEAKVIKQEFSRLFLVEVPHHTFRKTTDSSLNFT